MEKDFLEARSSRVPGPRRRHGCIARGSRSGILCCNVEIADSFLKRLVGLLGRQEFAEDAGLWLHPSSGVHTFGMRFAIDAIALDAQMKVVGLHRSLRAWRVAAVSPATHSVLELPAGQIDRSGIALGESVSFTVHDGVEDGDGGAAGGFGSERGSALIEFSLLLPVLVFLFVGIVDYGLETQQAMQIMEAASAGASYGAINGNQKDFAGMQNAAIASAAGVHGFSVTASNIFSCTPGGTPVTSGTVCPGYGTPIEYVKVSTSATVPTLLSFPGMPANLALQQTATYRVPWTP